MEHNDRGLISKIEHGSTNDGNGFRSVVYFCGCPLACQWCHNPELIAGHPQLMYWQHKCVGCNQCLSVCPDVFTLDGQQLVLDRSRCTLCGNCIATCQGEALQLSAKTVSVQEVFNEIAADKVYYKYSGGGVTFSGGECLMQHGFLKELLQLCRQDGIHTCVESCLFVPFSVIEEIAPLVDHFFVDIKHMDPAKHVQYTGHSNEKILENTQKLSALGNGITFRIPLIPGVNDDLENLTNTVRFINSLPGTKAKQLELLRYNNLAISKYSSIDKPFHSFGVPQTPEAIDDLVYTLDRLYDGVRVFYRH